MVVNKTQKLLAWFVGFLIVATAVSYFVMTFVKEKMEDRSYKGLDTTMSSLDKLELMRTKGAFDIELKNFPVIEGQDFLKQKGIENLNSLEDLKGKVILLNFWASWCEPCIQEFPDLVKLVSKVPEVVIVAISRDYQIKDAESFIKAFPESKGKILFVWDEQGDSTSLYGTEVLPESFIIDKDFKVVKKISGIEAWGESHIISFFKDLVSK